jgi:hypothetical protein
MLPREAGASSTSPRRWAPSRSRTWRSIPTKAAGPLSHGDARGVEAEALQRSRSATRTAEGGGAIHQQFSEESVQSLLRWTGIPSLLEPEDVVDAVVWALSTPTRARIDRIVLRELADIPT